MFLAVLMKASRAHYRCEKAAKICIIGSFASSICCSKKGCYRSPCMEKAGHCVLASSISVRSSRVVVHSIGGGVERLDVFVCEVVRRCIWARQHAYLPGVPPLLGMQGSMPRGPSCQPEACLQLA